MSRRRCPRGSQPARRYLGCEPKPAESHLAREAKEIAKLNEKQAKLVIIKSFLRIPMSHVQYLSRARPRQTHSTQGTSLYKLCFWGEGAKCLLILLS